MKRHANDLGGERQCGMKSGGAGAGRWLLPTLCLVAFGLCGCLISGGGPVPQGDPATAAGAAAVRPAGPSWSGEELLTFSLRMEPMDADVLFKKDIYDTSSFPVRMEDGEQLLTGRIEVKGSFTRRFPKKSLLLKLDKGQTWQGTRRISLNAMGTDPSMLREYLVWDLFRALGMAAPRVQYARLRINDEFVGLFLFVEWIEPRLFARYGLGDDGAFYHPRDSGFCGDLTPASLDPARECWLKLAPDDADFGELAELVTMLAATSDADFADFADRHLEIDSLLNWVAANVLTSNNDTYNKNYFLYRSKQTAKWTVVPWDYDLTFGRSWDPGLAFPVNIYNDNFQYYYPPDVGQANPLKDKLFANPELYRRFKLRLGHLMGIGAPDPQAPAATYGWWTPARMEGRIDHVRTLIDADRRRDHFLDGSGAETERDIVALRYYLLARYHYLKSLIFDKTAFQTSRWTPAMSALGRAEIATLPVPPAGERVRVPQLLRAAEVVGKEQKEIHLVDVENGLLLASLRLHELEHDTRLSVEVAAEQTPAMVPPGMAEGQCLERTWLVSSQDPGGRLVGDFRFEYLQEHSLHTELPRPEEDEERLRLWMLSDGDGWRPLPTRVNTLANTLTVDGLTVDPLRLYRFVACRSGAAGPAGGE